jgi:hypothetical protein
MGAVVTGSAVGFGVIGGMLGGARQLTWEAYRAFPVPFRTLFFAETAASIGDLVALGFGLVMSLMAVAFVSQAPMLFPLAALLLLELILWVLFLQHLVGTLAVTAVRRLRRAMVVLVVAAWSGMSLIAGAAREIRDNLAGADMDRLRAAWHELRPFVELLPPSLSVRAMVVVREGRLVDAALLSLPMAVTTLGLGALSYIVLERETGPRPLADTVAAPSPEGSMERRLSITWEIARLHLAHVAGSVQGRFGLVVPLITVVLVKGPLGAAGIGPTLTLPGSVIYLALAATQFYFNQFGLDGQGVKTLLLLPVTMREILLGKTLALVFYSLLQNVFLLVLLAFMLRPTPVDALAAGLLGGSVAVAHALEGHCISAIYPRPMAMHRMNAGGLAGANLLPLGVGLLNALLFGGAYALTTWWKPEAKVNVMLALFLSVVAVYRLLLPRVATFVVSRRENLVEVLG